MPLPLSRFQPYASSHSSLALPALLFLASLVANISAPTKNSLLTSAIAWLAVCACSTSKGSARSLLEVTAARKTAWAAGLLFALAQVCDKAADGRAIWWAKVITHVGGLMGTGRRLRLYIGSSSRSCVRHRRVNIVTERDWV